MKRKHVQASMKTAFNYAECSTAKRLKVGCVIVKEDRIISIGYNGMPSGWTNEREESTVWRDGKQLSHPILITKPEVLHAEENAITKLAKCTESGEGASAFITHAPCLSCSKLLHGSGIVEVYYAHPYDHTDGLEFLQKCGVILIKTSEYAIS